MISRYYYRIEANNQVQDFKNEVSKLDKEEIARRMKLARIYNDTFVNHLEKDPYTDKEKSDAGAEYARMLELHEKIGHIQVPKIDIDIPIYAVQAKKFYKREQATLKEQVYLLGKLFSHSYYSSLWTSKS